MMNLRWWIASLLFVSMVINYIDRQTFNALSGEISTEFGWTYAEFATVLISFRVAYTLMQAVSGRLLDWQGTRRGLAASVSFYSLVAVLTGFAQTIGAFRVLRFLLGAGEAANWPGAIKASAQWFSPKERAWVVALFDSGTSMGGVIAPFIALAVYRSFGDWRPVCVLTGSLGLVWVLVWLAIYRASARPLSDVESPPAMSNRRPPESLDEQPLPAVGWSQLLAGRPMWGIMLGRFLLDPYWFFVCEWFPLFLKDRGFSLDQSVLGMAGPLTASVFGNFAGGALSSYFIRRGWPVGRSRRTVLALFGPSMIVTALTLGTSDYTSLVLLFSYGNFAYSACSTMFLSLPADVFHSRAVASASGLAGTAAGLGTLLSTYLIGRVADQSSFAPVIVAASVLPCLATVVFAVLVRAPGGDSQGLVLDF